MEPRITCEQADKALKWLTPKSTTARKGHMQITLTLDTTELEALINAQVDARIAERFPPPENDERAPGPGDGFKDHADYAFKHFFPTGGPLRIVGQQIV